jgi:ribosome-binding ATPase YchF (GTP1/OBG family)
VLYVCNVAEDDAGTGNAHTEAWPRWRGAGCAESVVISAKPSRKRSRSSTRKPRCSSELGLEEAGLDRLIRAGYELLT